MKQILGLVLLGAVLLACKKKTTQTATQPTPNRVMGTWQLVRGTVIEKGDTVVTDYTQNRSFIKIINQTHFAFLLHDLTKGKDSTAVFTAGGGRYSLTGNEYTEHLEYCSDRAWEGHEFPFTLTFKQDTLIQRGVEQVASAGINRVNIEQYVKVKH